MTEKTTDPYWWCGFNLQTYDQSINGEEAQTYDLPDEELPFDIFNTGWGGDYATFTARVWQKDAETAEDAMKIIREKLPNFHSWRWEADEMNLLTCELGDRFS